jgi:ribosomal protein S3AE
MALKKKYFDVKLEVLNSSIPLLAYTPEYLDNKAIKFDLTKILKGKNCEARYIVHLKDKELEAEMVEFSVYPSFIRKMIGHNISIIEDSFSCKCKDAKLRIKPFLITRKRVHRSVRTELRNKTKEFLIATAENSSKVDFFQNTIGGSIQKELSKILKKIYPLAVSELRVVKVEKK